MGEEVRSADAKLVEKLTTILGQAQRGELTGFVAVGFREGGGVDQWGHLTRREDFARAPAQVEVLRQNVISLEGTG